MMGAIKQRQIDRKMSRACEVLYPAYSEKRYDFVAREGLAAINEFREFDALHTPLKSTIEACCPVVCYTAQSYEKLGKPDIAMDLYRFIIRRGCMGMLPFTRLAILLERDGDFQEAISVCDQALSNGWFQGATIEGAQKEFNHRKERLLKKAQKGRL